ncbi:MAG: DUF1385 domain-containing protein [Armatimonadota bacterium]|nr:DUF1385 domain-containing protein [Armatimonadota bacterium]MDR7435615.1 DUF1385 domain-containing protein [Armatimonadota bacterium]
MIGGQAVIEGVMMRGPHWVSVAVRRPDGSIATHTRRADSLLARYRPLNLPLLRGAIVLYEALVLGVQALLLSANETLGEEEKLSRWEAGLSLAIGLGLGIGLFFVLPTLLLRAVEGWFRHPLALNLGEGLVRVALVVGYIWGIARIQDLQRVFAYHGAEHKAVNAFEAKAPLIPSVVQSYSRLHLRCGTSFILIVMLLALLLFSLLGRPPLPLRILSRILLIPVIAGLGYEVIRGGARFPWMRPLVIPGLWLQRLTTREPDDGQVEVAIAALEEVVRREGGEISSRLARE